VVHEGLRTLLGALEVLRPAFTEPGFRNLIVIFSGWVLTRGVHAVTQSLVETSVPGRRHHEAFHRFFSRGTWDPDQVGHVLLDWLLTLRPDVQLHLVIDDTLAPKKGPNVYGIGSHLDAVRSTKLFRVFAFGHVWVVLSVTIWVPFSRRPWALPILFRLYRNKKECETHGHAYRKKTELAREMIDVVRGWVGERRLLVSMDCAYCNATVMRGLPASIVVFGSMRPDAVLTAPPVQKRKRKAGRPPVRGRLLPKPEKVAKNDSIPWQHCKATLYGRKQVVPFKELRGQWYRATGDRLLKIIVERIDSGNIGLRVFFCTDPSLSVTEILEGYGIRWSIEQTFRDLKQLLGFADSSARKKAAVERTAPFVGFIYTVLVLWFMQGTHQTTLATPPLRPWYTHKRGLSFGDVLRAAQRALVPLDVLDPASSYDNLQAIRPPAAPAPRNRLRSAA
jgi:hypothetical protein